MPQAVGAAVAKFVGIALGTVAASGVTTFLVKATFAVGLSILSSKLFAPKIPEAKAGLAAKSTTVRSTLEYRKIVYGEAVVSGPIVYHNLQGSAGEYAWYVIALCDGISESVESIWLDGSEIPASDIDWTPSATGDGGTGTGDVSTAAWLGDDSPQTSAVQAYWALGDPDQVDLTVINNAFTDWGTNHRGRGITYGALAFLYNANTEEIWNEFGQPNDIKFQIKGRKCYDRRKDALNSDPDFATVGKPVGEGLRWFSNFTQAAVVDSDFSVSAGVLNHTADDRDDVFSETFPVDTSKRYVATFTGQEIAGTPEHYLGVNFLDANGDRINSTSTPASDATGWGGIGTYHYFGRVNQRFAASATEYSIDFGVGGTATIPTGAVSMQLVWLSNFNADASSESEVSDAAIHEYVATRHDFADSSTWEWSDNPSVCLADYMTQVVGAAYAKIDWDAMIVAAQACDVLAVIPPAASPENTEKRFTCNGALSMGISHKDNINDILSSMFGRFTWKQGKWTWTAGVWTDPDVTIDGDWLTESDVEVQGSSATRERYNTVRGFYVDPNRKYESVEFAPVSDAAYVTRDNSKVLEFNLELPMTNSEFMAQRIAYRVLEQGDNQAVASMTLNERAAQLAIGDRVSVDLWPLGWTAGGNLLTYSEDLSQSAWTKTNVTVTTDDTLGPFGTANADRIEATTAAATTLLQQAVGGGADTGMTASVWVKRGTGDDHANRFFVRNSTTATNRIAVSIDFTDGSYTFLSGLDDGQVLVEPYPDGWFRITIFANGGGFTNGDDVNFYVGFSGSSEGANEYSYVYGAQLLAGFHMPPYYKKTTSAAVTTTAKNMRVIKWQPNLDGTHEVVLKEDDEASYDDPVVADYTDLTAGTVTAATNVVPPPTNLVATSVSYGVRLTWTNPPSASFDVIDVYASVDSAWSNATRIARIRSDTYTHTLASGDVRYYWIRAARFNTAESTREPDSDTSTVTGTSGGASPTATLTGRLGVAIDGVSPYNTTNTIRVSTDGNIYEGDSINGAAVSYTQVNTADDWIRGASDPTLYYVRYSNVTGTFTSTPGTINTAIAMTSNREWTLQSSSFGDTSVTFDLEILDTDGTTVLAGPTQHRVRCNNTV